MPRGIALRQDYDADALRRLARRSKDADASRRLLALAAIRDGMSRTDAARLGGMDRQTLRDWVHRFNAEGPEGLGNRSAPGRVCWLNPDQLRELAEIVETGPDPETDGVVRWRRIDLKRVIEDRFGVVYAERSISRLLADMGFVHISARPQHPAQKPKVIEAYKKTSPTCSPRI
jgi:transposase